MDINWWHSNHCIYFKRLDDDIYIILCLYVDFMLIARSNMDHIKGLKQQLSHSFAMKDLGEAKKIFGMKICRDRKTRYWRYLRLIMLRRRCNVSLWRMLKLSAHLYLVIWSWPRRCVPRHNKRRISYPRYHMLQL